MAETIATGMSQSDRFHAVAASFLGWTLDAFDFFVVVFLYDVLAAEFHVSKTLIVLTVTATLATRPLGALLFGLAADRYGRRIPLMVDVIFFSIVEVLCGFSVNFTMFLVLRILYGIGMGGEWGVGASLAMESAPHRLRGILSGFLQSGYSFGYLLAAIAARLILPHFGWRWMFWVGGIPALLALYIRTKVPESEAWLQHKLPSFGAILRETQRYWKRFLFLIVLMTLMMFLSHGTQDLYPDFLKHEHHISPNNVAYIVMLYNVGAILGAILFGQVSEKIRAPLRHARGVGTGIVDDPVVGFRLECRHPRARRFLDPDGCAGRVGHHPRTSCGSLARRNPRAGAGSGISTGNLDCSTHELHRIRATQRHWISLGDRQL